MGQGPRAKVIEGDKATVVSPWDPTNNFEQLSKIYICMTYLTEHVSVVYKEKKRKGWREKYNKQSGEVE